MPHFSLDPRLILGVGPQASLDEVQDAFRRKSKKHHPDMGGDEWAFRVVLRAYEMLRSQAGGGPDSLVSGRAPAASSWTVVDPSHPRDFRSSSRAKSGRRAPWRGDFGPDPRGGASTSGVGVGASGSASVAGTRDDRLREFRVVDVELIWIRFEFEGSGPVKSKVDADSTTLSVCLVVSWPRPALVERTAAFPAAGKTLRNLISVFDHVSDRDTVVASHSGIEDGRFVGWLSFPDVLKAETGFQALRASLSAQQLDVRLQTRDEPIPLAWCQASAPAGIDYPTGTGRRARFGA